MTASHTHRLIVQWGDCDPAGITFYPNYFRWFDDAARALFAEAGLNWRDLFASHHVVGLPLADARARFLAPSRYGDELTIETRVTEWRTRALVLSHTVRNDDAVVVEGTEVRVWGVQDPHDKERLRAGTIPAEIRERLGAEG